MIISPIYNTLQYKFKTVRKVVVKPSKVKDVTHLYKNVKLTLRGHNV